MIMLEDTNSMIIIKVLIYKLTYTIYKKISDESVKGLTPIHSHNSMQLYTSVILL